MTLNGQFCAAPQPLCHDMPSERRQISSDQFQWTAQNLLPVAGAKKIEIHAIFWRRLKAGDAGRLARSLSGASPGSAGGSRRFCAVALTFTTSEASRPHREAQHSGGSARVMMKGCLDGNS